MKPIILQNLKRYGDNCSTESMHYSTSQIQDCKWKTSLQKNDKDVLLTPTFSGRHLMCDDKPMHSTSLVKHAEKMAPTTYIKPVSKSMESFPVVKVNSHILIINENYRHTTVSLPYSTFTPRKPDSARSLNSSLIVPEGSDESVFKKSPTDNAVKCIARNKVKGPELRYEV